MGFALLHKRVVYLVAALGLVALSLGGEMALVPMLLCAAGFVASWWCEPPRIDSPRWAQGWTLGLFVLIALQLLRAWLGEPPLALALEVSCALQVSRLSNRRAAPEHQQIVLLGFLHLCAATVLSTEVTWALPFLGFVLVVPWALALTHLRGEIEAHFRADGDPAREGALARVLASRRVVGGRFLAGIAALSIPIFAFTAVLFLLFPRVGFGFLAFGRDDHGALTGFDDEAELGSVGTIRTDPTVVMRVTPPPSDDERPARAWLRLRGTSFDHYDGRRWSRQLPETPRALRDMHDTTFVITRSPGDDDELWDVVLDHFEPTVLFLLPGAVALEVPARGRGGVDLGREFSLRPGLDIRYVDDEGIGLHYGIWVAATPSTELAPGLTTAERDAYLQIPPGHETVVALAEEWTRGATSDRERAERIADRLRGSEFTYSLTMRDPGSEPPMVAFLTRHHTGHCEYFASSMVVLLRAVGVPARNVNGFLGGRWNSFGGYYAIQAGDAHAWTEVFLPGEGWVTFDATPSSRGAFTDEGFFHDLDALLDALDAAWQETIVEWDLGAQRSLFRRIARFVHIGGGDRSTSSPDEVATDDDETGAFGYELPLAGAVVLVLIGVWLWRRRRAGRGPEEHLPREVRDLLAVYRRLEASLSARGRPRPRSTTPLEHVAALEAEAFEGADDVRVVTERYVAVRFGGASITPEELAMLRARAERVGRVERPRPDRRAA